MESLNNSVVGSTSLGSGGWKVESSLSYGGDGSTHVQKAAKKPAGHHPNTLPAVNTNTRAQFCIGEIEPELHKTFAATRAPSDSFVYSEPEDLFQQLDDFCDEASMHYQVPPLVIAGRPGVGKSALLSNWLYRRTTMKRKPAATDNKGDVPTHKEFIFWHVAGCSRVSCQNFHMLRRLQSELRTHFDLTREVSKDDDRLRWDLPTFLEMAARKGKVIIIIDGLQRMRDADGEEDLKWLPLDYPGNVRVIVSVTVYDNSNGVDSIGNRRNKSLTEVKRRAWDVLEVKEMSNRVRKEVLVSYLKLTGEREKKPDSREKPGSASTSAQTSTSIPGLVLFPSHHKIILSSSSTANPSYLRVLLKALHWSAARNYDIWRVFHDWIQAESVINLYERIVNTWEGGLLTSSAKAEDCELKALKEGGYAALLRKHPWLQQREEDSASATLTRYTAMAEEETDDEESNVTIGEELPLSEVQWRKARADADKAINDAKAAAEKAAADVLARAARWTQAAVANSSNGQFKHEPLVNYFVAGHGSAPSPRRSAVDASAKGRPSTASSGAAEEYGAEGFDGDEDGGAGTRPSTGENEFVSIMGEGTMAAIRLANLEDVSLPPPSSSSSPTSQGQEGTASTYCSSNKPGSAEGVSRRISGMNGNGGGLVGREDEVGSSVTSRSSKRHIPTYLRGGKDNEGLGTMLGNALAVLYVARHGLTVTELTRLLLKLRESSDKKLGSAIWKQRELLLDMFKEMDDKGTGVLEQDDIFTVILRIDPKLKTTRLERLIKLSGAQLDSDQRLVNYERLIYHCGAVHRLDQPANYKTMMADADDIKQQLSLSSASTALDEGLEEALLEVLTALGVMYSRDNQVLVLTLENEALREVVRRRYVKNDEGEERWHNAIITYFQAQPSSLRRCEELPWHLHICRRWIALKDALSDLWAFELMYLGKLKNEFFEYWRVLTEGPLYLSEGHEAALKAVQAESSLVLSALDTGTVMGYTEAEIAKEKLCGQMPTFDMIECYNQAIEHWRSEVRPSTHRLAGMLHLIAQFLSEFSEVVKFQKSAPRFLRKPLLPQSMKLIGVEEENFIVKRDRSAAATLLPAGSMSIVGSTQPASAPAPLTLPSSPPEQALSAPLASTHAADNSYYFHRWIWLQFPWMALANTDLAIKMFGKGLLALEQSAQELLNQQEPAIGARSPINFNKELRESIVSTDVVPSKDPKFLRDVNTFQRMWLIKKQDPSQARAAGTDSLQFQTMIKSCMADITKFAENAEKFIKEACDGKAELSYRLAARPLDPTPKTGEDAGPFGSSTLRSVQRGSRVYTVDLMSQLGGGDKIDNTDATAAVEVERFGGIKLPSTVRDTLRQSKDKAVISGVGCLGHIRAHSYAMPITQIEQECIEARDRMSTLRNVLDKIRTERKVLRTRLEDLRRTASERDTQDLATIERLQTGEYVIDALQTRLVRMQAAVLEAEALGGFYKLIIEQCVRNPAKDAKRLECLDQQLSLAKAQLRDLLRQRQQVYLEKERIEHGDIRRIQQQLEQITKDRQNAQSRLATLRKKAGVNITAHRFSPERKSVIKMSERAAGPTALTVMTSTQVNDTASVDSQSSLTPRTPTKKELALRAGLDKVFELAGTENVAGIVEKLNNSYRLNQSLVEQTADCEVRLSELKGELQKMEKKLQAVNVDTSTPDDGGTATGRMEKDNAKASETHNISEAIFKEEMRALKNRRVMLTTQQFLDQVKTGVNHVARLAAKYSTNLSMPALRSADGLHEERYDDAEIYKALTLFEERITAMKESVAIEANEKIEAARSTTLVATTIAVMDDAVRKRHEEPTLSAAVDTNLVGINSELVLDLRREKSILARGLAHAGSNIKPKAQVFKNATDKSKIRIATLRVVEEMYDRAAEEVHRRQDEAHHQFDADDAIMAMDSKDGLQHFVRGALSANDSHIELRRTHIRELDTEARQFPDNDEGLGVAIEDALKELKLHIGKLRFGDSQAPSANSRMNTMRHGVSAKGRRASHARETPGSPSSQEGNPMDSVIGPSVMYSSGVLTREGLKARARNVIAAKRRARVSRALPDGPDDKSEMTASGAR